MGIFFQWRQYLPPTSVPRGLPRSLAAGPVRVTCPFLLLCRLKGVRLFPEVGHAAETGVPPQVSCWGLAGFLTQAEGSSQGPIRR